MGGGDRALLEQGGLGLAYINLETGEVDSCLARLPALLGYTPQELLGKTFLDLVHKDDHAAFNVGGRGNKIGCR